MSIEVKKPLFRYLDTNGDGSGTKNAVGDYSSVDTPFFIASSDAHGTFVINRMMIYVEDSGGSPSLATYGGLTALSDGMLVRIIRRNGSVYDLLGGLTIKRNSDWQRTCYDVDIATFPAGNNYVHARWTFSRSGWPVVLQPLDKLEVVARDNMSAYVEHYFLIQGYVD
jgi:hypothetical protein